jgi:hypothetical protein
LNDAIEFVDGSSMRTPTYRQHTEGYTRGGKF